jgi:tetratricopeptide (TPR) repeat protein
MNEPGANRLRAGERGAATAPSRRGRWHFGIAMAVVATALVVGAAGLLGWHAFRGAGPPRQAQPFPPGPALGRPEVNEKPSTLPLTTRHSPLTSGQFPIAPDLPRPRTVGELVEEVKRTVDRLVRSFPDDPDALEVKARVYYYLGDDPAAVACWKRCLELEPDYAYAYHGLGQVAAKKADYAEAAAQERKAWELAPGLPDIAVPLADALLKLDKPDEAVEVLEKHLAIQPRSVLAYLTLGHAHLQAKRYQKAHDAYRAALKIRGDLPPAQFGLATSLARLGRRNESRKAMETYKKLAARMIEVRPGLRSRFDDLEAMCVDFAVDLTAAARVCLARGDVAEALCRRAATLDPKNTECRIQLASLYQKTRRGEEALRMCRQLTEIDPESPAYHLNLGIMCGNLGRFGEAERALREAIRLAPQSAEAHAALARLYVRAGHKPDEAVAAIEKAIDLDPANPQYRDTLKRVRQGKYTSSQKTCDIADGRRHPRRSEGPPERSHSERSEGSPGRRGDSSLRSE